MRFKDVSRLFQSVKVVLSLLPEMPGCSWCSIDLSRVFQEYLKERSCMFQKFKGASKFFHGGFKVVHCVLLMFHRCFKDGQRVFQG